MERVHFCEFNVYPATGIVAPRVLTDIRDRVFARRCRKRAVQNHHVRRSYGDLYLDERYWLGSCAEHHHWAETHSNRAAELGYIERVYVVEKTKPLYIPDESTQTPSTMGRPMPPKAQKGGTRPTKGTPPKPMAPRRPARPAKMMKGVGPVLR